MLYCMQRGSLSGPKLVFSSCAEVTGLQTIKDYHLVTPKLANTFLTSIIFGVVVTNAATKTPITAITKHKYSKAYQGWK